jgi:hypothetical protein
MVADEMMTRSSGRFFVILSMSTKRFGAVRGDPLLEERQQEICICPSLVCLVNLHISPSSRLASAARRTMITLYRLNSGSIMHSLNSIPSVKYFIRVRVGDDRSSNRIEYPTCPLAVPSS